MPGPQSGDRARGGREAIMKDNAYFWDYVQTYPRNSKRAIIKPESPMPESGIGTRVKEYELRQYINDLDKMIHNMDPKPLPKKTLPKSSIKMPDYGKAESSNEVKSYLSKLQRQEEESCLKKLMLDWLKSQKPDPAIKNLIDKYSV